MEALLLLNIAYQLNSMTPEERKKLFMSHQPVNEEKLAEERRRIDLSAISQEKPEYNQFMRRSCIEDRFGKYVHYEKPKDIFDIILGF